MKANEWWQDREELVAFARHMVDDEGWSTSDVLAYLERPWRWDPERTEWSAPTKGHAK
jgi:hypothetical protein